MDSSSAQLQQEDENTCGNLTKTERPTMSSNRFTPLTNLNENLTNETRLACNSVWTSSRNPTKKSTNQTSAGNKIPSTINGRVMNGDIKKSSRTLVSSPRVPGSKNIKFDHKVRIIGDSYLKGSATGKNKYLNTKFEVCSFIKPGAHTNQIVHSQEMELKCLGRKDVIVINGGTNDIDNNSLLLQSALQP
jgi:hypothetical protein